MAKKRKLKSIKKRKPSKKKSAFSKAISGLDVMKRHAQKEPMWDLDRDGVSYSLLSKFITCRQRFHIGVVQGWKPKGFNIALEFGNVFHLLVEAQDMGMRIEDAPRVADNYVQSRLSGGNFDAESTADFYRMSGMACVTFQHYVKYWEDNPSIDDPELGKRPIYERSFEWLAKEKEFDFQYRMQTGRVIRLRGKRDGDFSPRKRGKAKALFETKTKGKIDEEGITKGLHKDMQTGMYLVAQQMDYRVLPIGVLYNVIRRAQLRPRKNESAPDFVARVDEDIQSRPDFYFMRWWRSINEQELEDFRLRQLEPLLFQICRWWDSIKRNPLNPFETQCPECDGVTPNDTCLYCMGEGVVPNPEHYERAFGTYDSMAHNQRGEYFDIVTSNNYTFFEQKDTAFPELVEEEPATTYMEGLGM